MLRIVATIILLAVAGLALYLVTLGALNRDKLSFAARSSIFFRRQFAKEPLKITGKLAEKYSSQYAVDPELPVLGNVIINFNPVSWAEIKEGPENVYENLPALEGCTQKIRTYDPTASLKELQIECAGEGEIQTYILTNGFGSSILYNGFAVLNDLLSKRKTALKVHLVDLPFQGFNGLKLTDDHIQGDSLLSAKDHFAQYLRSFRNYFQNTQLNERTTVICLSSSCNGVLRSLLTLAEEDRLPIAKIIMVGPYTGLTDSDERLQKFGHSFISPLINLGGRGKFKRTPFADPFALSFFKDEKSRLEALADLKPWQRSNHLPIKIANLDLVGKTQAHALSTQIDNPPLTWTNSAGKAHEQLLDYLLQFEGKRVPIEIYVGNKDTTVNMREIEELNALLRKKGFPGKLHYVEGPHNLFTGSKSRSFLYPPKL